MKFISKDEYIRLSQKNVIENPWHVFCKLNVNQGLFIKKSEWKFKNNPGSYASSMNFFEKKRGAEERKFRSRKIKNGWVILRIK